MTRNFRNQYDRIMEERSGSKTNDDQSMITIDHAPQSSTSEKMRKRFGKRNGQMPGASVSHDFFKTPPASFEREPLRKPLKANRQSESDESLSADKDFLGFLMTSGIPIKSIATVLMIAIAAPTAFIAFTENLPHSNIDPITTASVSTSQSLAITDVSMTRILKTGSSVVSIFGRVENRTSQTKPLQPLFVTLYDNEGKIVQSWRHNIKRSAIKGGQNFRFMTSAIDYSGRAQDVRVTTKPVN